MKLPRPAARPRPKPKLPLDTLDRLLQATAAAGWLALVAVAIAVWSRLPPRVPIHFDFAGNPDDWGPRAAILALPAIGTLLLAGLTLVERFPHLYNYPWPITSDNAERQYRLARRLLVGLKAIAAWMFAALTWGTARVGTGGLERLPPALLLVFLLALAVAFLLYFAAARRAR